MQKLHREDLMTLEKYAMERNKFRSEIMLHKKNRQIELGEHLHLYFEDKKTIQYQVQEMLRIEKIFSPDGIQEELDTYNPLIPDGQNWKVTLMLEYPDAEVRHMKVRELIGIEKQVWVQVAGFIRVYSIADEDLERVDDEKTATVHFLRFELTALMVSALKQGAKLKMGVDHPRYEFVLQEIPENVRASLVADLENIRMN